MQVARGRTPSIRHVGDNQAPHSAYVKGRKDRRERAGDARLSVPGYSAEGICWHHQRSAITESSGSSARAGWERSFSRKTRKLGRKVAIKMLSETLAGSHQARQRLINEAKAAAALDHPNICSIYEVGEEDDHVFIVMQYIDGQSLAERIWKAPTASRRSGGHRHTGGASAGRSPRRRHHPSRHQASEHRHHAARTAEGAGFWTREDRAAQMLPTVRMRRRWERLTEAGGTVGTPGFMSPEQLRGKDDRRTQRHFLARGHALRVRDRHTRVRTRDAARSIDARRD